MKDRSLKVYFSHRISGGLEDPKDIFEINCLVARDFVEELQKAFPDVEFYVPGGPSEEFVNKAYKKSYLSVAQILNIDCDILAEKDVVLCLVPKGDKLQGGRQVEVEFARKISKPVYIVADIRHAINSLNEYITGHN